MGEGLVLFSMHFSQSKNAFLLNYYKQGIYQRISNCNNKHCIIRQSILTQQYFEENFSEERRPKEARERNYFLFFIFHSAKFILALLLKNLPHSNSMTTF